MSGLRWAEKLRQFNEEHSSQVKESQQGDDELLEEYYTQFKDRAEDKKYDLIPKFYSKPPTDDQVLQQKLREEARATFLQRRSSELMDNEELQKLWSILEEKHTPPDIGEEQVILAATQKVDNTTWEQKSSGKQGRPVSRHRMIGFNDFMEIRDQVSEKCSYFFTAKVFAKLLRDDPYGRVSIAQLFSYIMRKVWLQQTRIGLSLFDIQGLGYLKESDLENYILELIPTLPQLNCLEESFYSFYVCTAVRKFFFFLDPMRTGKIKIQDILACGFLDDLLELRDEDLPKEAQETNWFSAPSALRVYGQYLSLDTDHNGMLNKDELLRYGTGTLTKVFVDRIFQECLTYDGEVDYKTYLDFVLAMENRKEPQALQYLLRLVDIRGQGYLDAFTLNYFFRAIQEQMKLHGHEPVKFEDIKDEIFDMVKPANPLRITLQDLISSGQGDTVISILTDLNGFWTYENREVLLAENQDIGAG